ncbi:MAG TPA: GNAT family N-acetyltransferase [Vineibacter sp.]|nr:GNAT family N-acetyltransferase [Vineibacter sp.]
MSVEIRQLAPHDAAILDHVAPDVFDAPVDPRRTAAYLAEPGHIILVAIAGGIVIAQVASVNHRHPDKPTELYIDEVGVTPAWQRQGIAQRMLDRMFAIGAAMGCAEAWVGTETDNQPARRLYESRGGTTAEPFVMYVYKLQSESSTSDR